MSVDSEHNCGNCDAWLPNKGQNPKSGEARIGWCRARPPTLIQGMQRVGSALDPNGPQMIPVHSGSFPPATADMWCREWKQKTD